MDNQNLTTSPVNQLPVLIQPLLKKSNHFKSFSVVFSLILFGIIIGVLLSHFLPTSGTAINQRAVVKPMTIISQTTNSPSIQPTAIPTATSFNPEICSTNKATIQSVIDLFEHYQIDKNIAGVKSLLVPISATSDPGDIDRYNYWFNSSDPTNLKLYSGADTTYYLKTYSIVNGKDNKYKEWGQEIQNNGFCYFEVKENRDHFSGQQKIPTIFGVQFLMTKIGGSWKVDSYLELGTHTPGKYTGF